MDEAKWETPKPPYQKAHEVLEKGKEDMRHVLSCIFDDKRPVQNESRSIAVENVVDSLRGAAEILDDTDDAKAAELRAKAVELRQFSRNIVPKSQKDSGYSPTEEFKKLAEEILKLETMSL